MRTSDDFLFWKSRTWKLIFQNKNTQPLIVAIFLSTVVHALLITHYYVDFLGLKSIQKNKQTLIYAQLVLKKTPPIPTTLIPETQVNKIETVPSNKNSPAPLSPRPEVETSDANVDAPNAEEMATEAVAADSTSPILADEVDHSAQTTNENLNTLEQNLSDKPVLQSTDSATVVNDTTEIHAVTEDDANMTQNEVSHANVYRYVETAFEVFTEPETNVSRAAVGNATMVYQASENGKEYQLKSLMVANGLAALVVPDLLQTSVGEIIDTGLQPKHYLYQFGNKKNKTFQADFDWAQKKLHLLTAKGPQDLALVEGTQDLLSFMYQFMFVPPLNQMEINITNGKKVSAYHYSFEGEELIDTKLGKMATIHLLRNSDAREEKTELWLALDYRYLPVKIRKTEKQDKVYELLVTNIKTDSGNLSVLDSPASSESQLSEP